ncbi:MAG: hypothetical protein V1492_01145 [Candidatus Micrarchaeota archaeon]
MEHGTFLEEKEKIIPNKPKVIPAKTEKRVSLRTETVIAGLVERLGNDKTAKNAETRLLKLGTKALPALFEASLDSENATRSENSAKTIIKIGNAGLPFLISQLKDEDGRTNAAYLLGSIIEKNEFPLDKVKGGTEILKSLRENAVSKDATESVLAISVLGKTRSAGATELLVRTLLNKNEVVGQAAENALVELGEHAVDAIVGGLWGSDEKLSKKCEKILVKIGSRGIKRAFERGSEECNNALTKIGNLAKPGSYRVELTAEFRTLELLKTAIKDLQNNAEIDKKEIQDLKDFGKRMDLLGAALAKIPGFEDFYFKELLAIVKELKYAADRNLPYDQMMNIALKAIGKRAMADAIFIHAGEETLGILEKENDKITKQIHNNTEDLRHDIAVIQEKYEKKFAASKNRVDEAHTRYLKENSSERLVEIEKRYKEEAARHDEYSVWIGEYVQKNLSRQKDEVTILVTYQTLISSCIQIVSDNLGKRNRELEQSGFGGNE